MDEDELVIAFLVRLRPRQGDVEALRFFVHVCDVDRRDFAARNAPDHPSNTIA
jgi:hypothetical protein